MNNHKFPYNWTLKDANFTKDKGKVFSCFSCGGGSTMGYKLAGFDVIGCNEIDQKMMEVYKLNHNPKYAYLESIQTFKLRDDLPQELYELDILDGSPPCSSFSMAGNREKDWGKKKKFREGQAEQVLDTLFFDFLDLAEKLKPKVVIAENVKGLLMGEAKAYVDRILNRFDEIGYYVDFKLLDASKMGVPQKRERVFFYAIRKDLYEGQFVDLFGTRPYLDLEFNEKEIVFSEIIEKNKSKGHTKVPNCHIDIWNKRIINDDGFGCTTKRLGKEKYFNTKFLKLSEVAKTMSAHKDNYILFDSCRKPTDLETLKMSTFPIDYNFNKLKSYYVCGMSVPPVMTAQIASRVYEQWLKELK